MQRALALACLALPACSASVDTDTARDAASVDSGLHGAPLDSDVGGSGLDSAPLDADVEATPRDAGRCIDTALTADCLYWGYGALCHVDCDFPTSCTFDVQVTWYGNGYCCGWPGEGHWIDCVCEGGTAHCRPSQSPFLGREIPATYCEFCGGSDAGTDGGPTDDGGDDAGIDDAGS